MAFRLMNDAPSEESLLGKVGRNVLGAGARIVETIAGTPGDISSVIDSLGEGLKNITGLNKILPSTEDFKNPLPTSEGLRKNVTQKLTGEYLEPKNEFEKIIQDFTQDLTSFMTPVPGLGRMATKKALLTSGLGNLARWVSKDVGASEGTQSGVKIGTMLLTSMVGPSGLRNKMKESYDMAENAIKPGAMVSTKHLEPTLEKIENILKKGEMTPAKQFLSDRVTSVRNKIKEADRVTSVRNKIKEAEGIRYEIAGHENKIPVEEAWELKRNMNEWFDEKPKGVEKMLPSITKGLKDTLEEYGRTNKDFLDNFHRAEDLYVGFNKASKMNSFLQRHINKDKLGHVAASMLLGPTHIPVIAKIVGGTVAARYLVQGIESLKNSATIQKHYAKVLATAAARNTSALGRELEKFNKAVYHELPKLGSKSISESGQSQGRFRLVE